MHEAMFFCNLQRNLLDNIALQVVVNMLHAAPTCFDNVARSRGLQSQSGLMKHFLPRHPQRGAEGRGGEGKAVYEHSHLWPSITKRNCEECSLHFVQLTTHFSLPEELLKEGVANAIFVRVNLSPPSLSSLILSFNIKIRLRPNPRECEHSL